MDQDKLDFDGLVYAFKQEVSPFIVNKNLIPKRNRDDGTYTIPALCDLPTVDQQPYMEAWQQVERLMEEIKWHKYVHKFSRFTTVIGRGATKKWIPENTQQALDLMESPVDGFTYYLMSQKTARQAEQNLMQWIYR